MGFSVGEKVKIISCIVREELTGIETEITEEANNTFAESDYADNYDLPSYRVAVDKDFRPIESQLELVN